MAAYEQWLTDEQLEPILDWLIHVAVRLGHATTVIDSYSRDGSPTTVVTITDRDGTACCVLLRPNNWPSPLSRACSTRLVTAAGPTMPTGRSCGLGA